VSLIPFRATGRKLGLGDIAEDGSGLPSRIVVYGPEGAGKSSLGAAAPRPIYILTRGETGLLTLRDYNLVPATSHFPEIGTWTELLDVIQVLIDQDHDYKTLVIDTLNGAEGLCHEHVCQRDFGGR
jgi:hypothetical protein